MDSADNSPDGRYFPLINVNTTNHNIYRAIDRRPELYPGGVVVGVVVVVALFTATATATPGFCCCCCCCALAFIYLASDVIIVMFRL